MTKRKFKDINYFYNRTIREAIRLCFKNKPECIKIHGHISNWDTLMVTDMSYLFNESIYSDIE